MGWIVAQCAVYWIIGWCLFKIAHMFLSQVFIKDWSLGNGLAVLAFQGFCDVQMGIGVLGVIVGVILRYVT